MKYKKWLTRACLILALICALRFGFKILITQYTNKFISPNKTNIIKIEAVSSNLLLFGPSDIRIKCRKNNFLKFINGITINTFISNDGKQIDNSNVNIEWISEDTATITLSGEEQPNEVIKVTFEDVISYKQSN